MKTNTWEHTNLDSWVCGGHSVLQSDHIVMAVTNLVFDLQLIFTHVPPRWNRKSSDGLFSFYSSFSSSSPLTFWEKR